MTHDVSCRKAVGIQGWKGESEVEMPSDEGQRWESPRGLKAQESNRPRPGLILRVGPRGTAFQCGSKPLKRRYKAEGFYKEAQERRGRRKRRSDHLEGDKALKSEAQERWGLKEASKGVGTNPHVQRVAKPCRRDISGAR
jgi:hypothetical protein